MSADLIVLARVLTMDEERPRAAAVAVGGGRLLAVGTEAEALAHRGPGTEVVEARGATLLPGFVESHCHLFLGGSEIGHLALAGVMGFEALAERVRGFAGASPEARILMAQGADYALLGRPMTRHDLDRIVPDRPLALTAGDHHTMWANTAALEAGGLLHGLALPPGSEVVMGADGLALGELREPPSFAALIALAGGARASLGLSSGEEPDPAPSAAERAADRELVARAARHLAAQGVTSAVNMDGNRYTLELLSELEAEGRLPLRVQVAFHFKPHMDLAALERASAMARDWDGPVLRGGLVKMFMDGVLESGTALTLEDHPGRPGWRGEPLFAPERFAEVAVEADRRGLQVAVHAIGDGAVRVVLDGYEAARAANGARDARHRVEHVELIHPADLPRLAALGAVASVQPPHAPAEPLTVGRHRWADAYRWRTLGAPLCFGSDWPVADASVLKGMAAALGRAPYAGGEDERVGLMGSLRAYTAGGAWASHAEASVGRLRVGMLGDLVLLSGDVEAEPVGALSVALTARGGRVTHRA